jgi:tetratricopeptide (TPR) repeat protein
MKLFSFFLFITLILPAFVQAQKDERDANMQFKQQNYMVALKEYKALQKDDTLNQEYNYRLGICYLNCNDNPAKALTYLLKAIEKNAGDAQFQLDLTKAYLYNYKFNDARQSASKALNLAGKNGELKEEINKWISMIDNAERLVKNPLDVSFINLGKSINSELDETTPIITPDNELLFYTSNRAYDTKYKIYTSDVYFSTFEDGNFQKGRSASAINSYDDEFVAGVSNSGERMFYQLQGFDAFEDLLVSDIINGNLKGKTLLTGAVNFKGPEHGAAESQLGDTLFFSSNRESSIGDMDIFYSLKLPTGEWGEARNLGNGINTIFDEDFPVLSPDGTKLYFCSNGPASMGGFDVFEAKIDPKTREIGTPRNIGYPLNDVFDNKTIAFSADGNVAYVSAIRPDSYGYTDLYRVVFNQKDPSVKIFLIKLTTLTNNLATDFGAKDTTIRISVQTKTKNLFGKYAYDSKSSQATIALPPGTYYLEVEGIKIEPFSMKITVPEVPGNKKIEPINAVLQLKKQ